MCGSQPEATAALLELAALLPTSDQQLALQQASQPTSAGVRSSTGPGSGQLMARGQRADPSERMSISSTTATGAGDAARQAAVAAPADLEAAADSSLAAQINAPDPRAGGATKDAVDRMLDDSWMASRDSRYLDFSACMCAGSSWGTTISQRSWSTMFWG